MKLSASLFFGALAVIAMMAATAPDTHAQKILAENGDWTAYTMSEDGRKVCYMFSRPKKEEGNYKRRGVAYAMVTRRQGSPTVEDMSVTSGYPYKQGSKTTVNIDGKKFSFGVFAKEFAWSDDPKHNSTLVRAMIKGIKLSVRGTSRKDTYSTDTYSLKGFTATHKAIKKACP